MKLTSALENWNNETPLGSKNVWMNGNYSLLITFYMQCQALYIIQTSDLIIISFKMCLKVQTLYG